MEVLSENLDHPFCQLHLALMQDITPTEPAPVLELNIYLL